MLEDIALMRVLPNMTVMAPADATEMEAAIHRVAESDGPFYVRMGREDAPILFDNRSEFEIGKAKLIDDGDDVTLIGTGTMVAKSIGAREILKKDGIDARVISMHTIKPIDTKSVLKAARETGAIVTVEEHSVIGGLGDAVAEVLGEEKVLMKRIGIQDVFGESGGARELMEKYGLTADRIAAAAKELVSKNKK
jgi:transketolase